MNLGAGLSGTALIHLRIEVNNHPVELWVEPRELLLDVLRDRLGLTGAKRSCDVQVCGTCTVLVDGQPVSACCYLAYEARGRRVQTIEGLAGPAGLHPLQQAFIDHAAVQCGFCTSGMILTAAAFLTENPDATPQDVRANLSGNLCRCTGYWKIIDAVVDAARRTAEASTASAAASTSMSPPEGSP